MRTPVAFFLSCLLIAGVRSAQAQTFEINGQSKQPSPASPKSGKKPGGKAAPSANAQGSIGWGSSIEVSRIARAAQDAARRGDAAQAADYAERAAKAAPQNPDFWFLWGYSARIAGRYQASVDAYDHGLQLRPSSIEGLSGLAQTYARMGKSDEAKKLLMRVIAANPKNANDLLLAGELFLNSGDPQQALPLLQRGEARQPSARAELLMAKAYVRMNQPAKAKEWLQKAKNRAPNNPDVLRSVAGFYRDAGDYNDALAVLRQVRSHSPDWSAEIGYTYQLAGKRTEAAQFYSQAASAAPRDLRLQLSAAQALVAADQLEKARHFLNRADSIQPDHYRVHALRGEIARMESHTAEAIQEYEAALKAAPGGASEGVLYPIELRMTLAQLYRDDNNEAAAKQQAIMAAEQIRNVDMQGPMRAEFLRLRASIETENGGLQAAQKDLKEALALDPANSSIQLQYGNLLWRLQDKPAAQKMFLSVLAKEPTNRYALTSLGYLSRDMGDTKSAETYFARAAKAYPDLYIPFLALGDLHTAVGNFQQALEDYEKAYKLAPNNPLIVAGGMNASLESHKLELTRSWLARAKGPMRNHPMVMREHERYLTWMGNYAESAKLGWQVIEKIPNDREAPVYLAYDLLYLGRYDDALKLAQRYQPILPKEKDLWLIAGYVHTHSELLTQAVEDFTHALELDPKMATGYVNRGFVLNDVQNARQAAQDFERAIRFRPDYGEAHLGLAYASLQLRRPKIALQESETAERYMGESKATHLARAGAYRQQLLLTQAEKEYRAALKYSPNELPIHLALAETLYRLHRYNDSIDALEKALKLSPGDPSIYAQMAHSYARLQRRAETFRYIEAAERQGADQTDVLLSTGDALLTLGDRDAAMERFARALVAPDGEKVPARLAIAKVFAREGKFDDARQQVSLGFAESRVGEAAPITSEDLTQAADIFLQTHDFDLAKKYFERAKAAGADESVIAIGMANAYLAQGQTQNAEAQLNSLGNASDYDHNFDYTMAMANVYRQRRDTVRAMTLFARADGLAAEDEAAERAELDMAGQEGTPITDNLSVLPRASFAPIFEDINIYQLDAKLLNIRASELLPPPRYSYLSKEKAAYKIHLGNLPTISGFLEERNARGTISIPSALLIQDRNTYDTSFNSGINPVLRLGSGSISFNPGLQFTVRRDTLSPLVMNQNLFRQFLYVSTSPFFNWISMQGSLMHEAGPFTDINLRSRDLIGTIGFTVGRPWGRTALVTSYTARDVLFRPLIREYYQTTTGIGIQRKFGERLTATILGEYLRAWRVQDNRFATAQAMRPAARVEYRPRPRWAVEGAFAFSRGQGFHFYDNVQSEFLVSYVKPVRRTLSAIDGDVSVAYPFRFSVGLQQQNFYNFSHDSTTIVPVVRLALF